MSAFYVFHVSVKDTDKFQQYAQQVPATLQPYGGEIIQRGKATQVLTGNHPHQAIGIISFDNIAQANHWYQSDAYQNLIPLRDQAADITTIQYQSL